MDKIKEEDIISVTAISWNEDWEFDFPSALIYPVLHYYEDGISCDTIIENAGIDLCIDGEINSIEKEHFRMRSVFFLKLVIFLHKIGINIFKKRIREIITTKLYFFKNADGEMKFEELAK